MATVRKRTWRTSKGGARTAWAVDYTDLSGNRERKQFATKAEATDFRVSIEGQIRAGTYRPDAAKVTVEKACDDYLTHIEGRKDRRERMTRRNYDVLEGRIHNYICPDPTRHQDGKRPARLRAFDEGLGAVKLAHLTPSKVGDFRDRLRNAGVSVATTRKILGTLGLVLEYAISRDLVAVNAARGVRVIGRRDEGSKKVVPPPKEGLKRLIEVADADFRVQLIVASATGLRAGEFHALRWRHVNLAAREITVETRVDPYGDEDVTKTVAGMRTVPLGIAVVKVLKEWKVRSKRKRPDDLVFPNRRGTYASHDNMVKRKFVPLFTKLAELHKTSPKRHPPSPAPFPWHALRHFAISTWIEAGLSPKTVQTFAGHSSLQVTMDRYGHLFKSEDHKKAMDAISAEMFK